MSRTVRPSSRALVLLSAVLLLLGAATSSTVAAPRSGGNVLPPAAQPHGWSLDRMTLAHALFTTSGQNAEFYPNTPFQVLHVDPLTGRQELVDGGVLSTGSNDITVLTGTPFFLPLWNATDSPPVAGTFPTTRAAAADYFFDPEQLGARDLIVTVDGRTTAIDRSRVSSPVTSPVPLKDGGGSRIVTVGVFLTPMTPGTHEVTISGGLYGALLLETYDIAFLAEDFTYTVTVVPGRGPKR